MYYIVKESVLQNIANAIREKTNFNNFIAVKDFSEKIKNIDLNEKITDHLEVQADSDIYCVILEDTLVSIADAIRQKTNSDNLITVQEFEKAIRDIVLNSNPEIPDDEETNSILIIEQEDGQASTSNIAFSDTVVDSVSSDGVIYSMEEPVEDEPYRLWINTSNEDGLTTDSINIYYDESENKAYGVYPEGTGDILYTDSEENIDGEYKVVIVDPQDDIDGSKLSVSFGV